MSNVKNTLLSALPVGAEGAYPREFANVVAALTERDYKLTDQIVDVVNREFGTDKATVRNQLVLAGMEVRPAPAPAPVPDMKPFEDALTDAPAKKKGKKGKKSEVAKLAKTVNKLVKAARNHGVSI
jgi:hypothetical protein